MKLLAPAIALLVASAAAVDIALHLGEHCAGNFALCGNIPKDNCCFNAKNLGRFGSAHFKGLGSKQLGGILDSVGNKICGKLVGLRHGSGCVDAKGHHASGSAWEAAPRREVDEVLGFGECAGAVLADVLGIDGHVFRVNYDVPEGNSALLDELLRDGARYEDIPEGLKKWEM